MKRKIVKHGPSSLTVTLPMKWVKQNNLKNGDEVEVYEAGSEIIVSGKGKEEHKEIKIALNKSNPLLKRVFVMPYINGYDTVKISFDSSDVLEFIEKNIDLLYGFEIVDHNTNSCILKNITTINSNEFDTMFSRLINIISLMALEFKSFIETGNQDNLKKILLTEKMVTKTDLFCRRILNQFSGEFKERKVCILYSIVRLFEGIGDNLYDLAGKARDTKLIHKDELKDIIENIIEGMSLVRKAIYTKQIEHIYIYRGLEMKLRKLDKLEEKLNKDELNLLSYLKQISTRLHNLSEEVVCLC